MQNHLVNAAVEVRPDERAGQGLFLTTHAQAGHILFSFADSVPIEKARWSSIQVGVNAHVDELAQMRYLNHSCAPNVFVDTLHLHVEALRVIEPNEELRFFYHRQSGTWHSLSSATAEANDAWVG